jgi:hypothetical protein
VAGEVLESQGVGIGVECESALNGQVHDHKTLGTQLVRQDLNGVADEQTGPGERVEDLEEPDEEDHGVAGAGGVVLVVETRGEGPEDEGAEHTASGSKEEGATADLVDEHSHGERDDERHASLASAETELGSRVLDTGRLVQGARVVGNDGVTRPLREETERDKDGEAVAVALGAEEVHVAAAAGSLELEAKRLLDLAELELDSGVVDVAVGVVLGEGVESLVVLVLGHVETRRLRDPEDEGQLDERGNTLEQGRDTPRPVIVEVVGAEGNPRDDCTVLA